MNLTSKQETRLKYLAIIVVISVIVFLVVFAENYLIKEIPSLSQSTTGIERVEIDFTVLENPILKEFQPFEEISLNANENEQ